MNKGLKQGFCHLWWLTIVSLPLKIIYYNHNMHVIYSNHCRVSIYTCTSAVCCFCYLCMPRCCGDTNLLLQLQVSFRQFIFFLFMFRLMAQRVVLSLHWQKLLRGKNVFVHRLEKRNGRKNGTLWANRDIPQATERFENYYTLDDGYGVTPVFSLRKFI